MQAKGYKVTTGAKLENLGEVAGASKAFVNDVIEILGEKGGSISKEVQDQVFQLYLHTLPDVSLRKHFIHRSKTLGYHRDALRSYAHQMFHGAHQLAKIEYVDQLQQFLDGMKEDLPNSSDPTKAAHIYNELSRSHKWAMNPEVAQWANTASSIGFAMFLGVTPAAGVVNLTQTPIIAFPVMAAKYGWGKAASELLRASGNYFSGGFDVGNSIAVKDGYKGNELKAFNQLEEEGVFTKTLAHNLAGTSETEGNIYGTTKDKVMNVVSFIFHHAEVFNRQVTSMATYRLARASGESHDQAIMSARDITYEAHFDYSNSNRTRFMRGDALRVMLMFRQYSQNITYFLIRNTHQTFKGADKGVRRTAYNKLAGVLGMTLLFAGAKGLPLFSEAMWMLEQFFDDEDEPWSAEVAFRQFLADYFGKKAGQAIANGPVEAFTGIGISSRVSLDELWFREQNRELEGKAYVGYWLEQLAGPFFGGIPVGIGRGYDLMQDGHYMRGLEQMLPKVIKDGMKAVRYANEGLRTLKGDALIEKLSVTEVMNQFIGFLPARVREVYEQNSARKNVEQRILNRRQKLMNRFSVASMNGDIDMVDKVTDDMQSFNNANPEIPISVDTIIKSMKGRAQRSASSINGMIYNRRLRYIEQTIDFAE